MIMRLAVYDGNETRIETCLVWVRSGTEVKSLQWLVEEVNTLALATKLVSLGRIGTIQWEILMSEGGHNLLDTRWVEHPTETCDKEYLSVSSYLTVLFHTGRHEWVTVDTFRSRT